MTDYAVEVEHLTKTFTLRDQERNTMKELFVRGGRGGKTTFNAVDDLSFSIEKGTTFGLVGHNGSGKSTLLKTLAGVYRPTSGQVRVRGKVSALLELGAGFHPELTGRENIRLNGAILGLSRKQIAQSTDAIIDFAELGPFIDLPVKQYSSGMYVRLGFAIAVMLKPDVLIVDEVIAVGDEAFQRKCFDHLYKLRAEGTTIALVTHSMPIAREMCDEAIWLDHGKAKFYGPIDQVVDQYIQDVNRAEEAQYIESLANAQDLPRRGTGEAFVETAEFVDQSGKPCATLITGNDYTLRLHIDSKVDIGDVDVVVEIYLETGALLASVSSAFEGRPYNIPVGRTDIDLFLPNLPLQQGSYWVSTSLRTRGHVWDHIDKGIQILVRSRAAAPLGGPVRLPALWSEGKEKE
mgnify:FL=1